MRLLIAIAASSFVLAASAIEAPKPAAPPSAPATEAPPSEEPDEAKVEEEDETLPPLPADAAPAGPPPARFNPTEKVRADFPVSFPIDI
ncbi:MAG TPA: hypothetical protein VGA24_11650 [Steroidobacteraceae bacterium]